LAVFFGGGGTIYEVVGYHPRLLVQGNHPMPITRPICRSVWLAAVLLTFMTAGPAAAIGYWNLPGNFCQWAGYGNGGGYHACFMLGPITHEGWATPNEVRLPCPPNPACAGCGYAPCGCGNVTGREFASPSMLWEYTRPSALSPSPTPTP
jgi:hypothetical protein